MMSCVPLVIKVAVAVLYVVPFGATQICQFSYSYLNGPTGNFSSPGFPEYYPSLLRCYYYFNASKNGGVEIKFDTFELEDKKEGDDVYDYIDVFTVDSQNFKTFLNRFCGRKIPHTIISPQSKLEIKFVTDHWQNSATGFSGRYRFLGDDWQPFDHKPNKCGSNNLSGVAGFIHSPNYPHPYPTNVNCSWVINVPNEQQILVRIIDLNIDPNSECSDSFLRLYNGYATSMSVQTKQWCGRLRDYNQEALQYRTVSGRTVIRFASGPKQNKNYTGFKLLWLAYYIAQPPEVCHGFQCEGGQYCENRNLCTPLPKYCISKQLVCDGVQNCGPFDDSDERKCTREILIMAACITVPSLLLVMMVALTVHCYKSRHVKKSASQNQPLANSQSQHGTISRESFTSGHRQMMLHTSFIDGAGINSTDLDHGFHEDNNDIDQETTHGLFSDGTTGSLRTHKKRPSYHMMQQNYEDGILINA